MIIAGHQVDEAMFSYIARHADADTHKLLLKAEPKLTFDKSFAILQIECRKRSKNKIPELLRNERFLFPKSVSAEQCTHEIVAQFHAAQFCAGDHVLDMTMGLGVDDYYISQRVKSLTSIELDAEIAEIGQYNFSFLNPAMTVIHGDSTDYIQNHVGEIFDAVFIDPARRGDSGKRLYGLSDCHPDVLGLLPIMQGRTHRLFVKASPMLDVAKSIVDLGEALTDVWAVSIKNECKELFFRLDFDATSKQPTLHALNYDGEWHDFVTTCYTGCSTCFASPEPGAYLYEPNASVMKLACFDALSHHYSAMPIAKNSHLFVGQELLNDFPGRKFVIEEVVPFKDREVKNLAKRFNQMNVATRNFRLKAEELKHRLKVRDGGDIYLFATILSGGEQVLIITSKA